MNSLNLSFEQELKSSYSNKKFSLINNKFRKNGKKKKKKKKNLIVCALPEIEDHINSFQVDLFCPHHLKISGFLYF